MMSNDSKGEMKKGEKMKKEGKEENTLFSS
jgi:hypothetical protein